MNGVAKGSTKCKDPADHVRAADYRGIVMPALGFIRGEAGIEVTSLRAGFERRSEMTSESRRVFDGHGHTLGHHGVEHMNCVAE